MRIMLAVLVLSGSARLAAAEDTPGATDLAQAARGVRWVRIRLADTCPVDLEVSLRAEHHSPRFAEFVYGTPESRRVAIVVAQTSEGGFALYVDKQRDRIVTEREYVDGEGDLRLASLSAEHIVDDVAHPYSREVLFRWRPGDNEVQLATLTTPQHTVHPDGDEQQPAFSLRLRDGNANGLFADPSDFVLADFDGNERIDPFREVFPFRPVLEAAGSRWFVRADPFGQRLNLQSATATGRLQLQAALPNSRDRFAELIVTVEGEDGSVFSLTGASGAADLPVGRYAASVLFAAVQPNGSARRWEYTFSRNSPALDSEWFEVRAGETLTLDPIGTLVLDAQVATKRAEADWVVNIQPRLWTATRLLINSVKWSDAGSYEGPQGMTLLSDTDGRTFGTAHSGFA